MADTYFSNDLPRVMPTGYAPVSFGADEKKKLLAHVEIDEKQEIAEADKELEELEADYTGMASRMFPDESNHDKVDLKAAAAWRKKIKSEVIKPYLEAPWANTGLVYDFLTSVMNDRSVSGLRSSLVGQPREFNPKYKAIWPMLVQKGPTKDWYLLKSGQDTIEYESPLETEAAFVWNPTSGDMGKVMPIVGGRSSVDPFFITTRPRVLDIYEWAQRQIKPLAIMKIKMTEQLDQGIDIQVKLACDNATPNGTLYSAHPTHITATDNSQTVTFDRFRSTGRFLRHQPIHRSPKGIALCAPSAVDALGDLGTDYLTRQTVEELTRKGLSQYDPSTVLGLDLDAFSLVEDPLEADAALTVRYYSKPDRVGLYIPVTFQGKQVMVIQPPMNGQDPDWVALQNSQMPPGFQFVIQSWMAMAIVIDGYYNLSRLDQT